MRGFGTPTSHCGSADMGEKLIIIVGLMLYLMFLGVAWWAFIGQVLLMH